MTKRSQFIWKQESRVRDLARKYERRGYKVHYKPRGSDLPEFLQDYAPDLLLLGEGEAVVVEVKSSRAQRARELERLAKAVDAHPGWRLELVVGDAPAEADDIPAYTDLKARMQTARELLDRDRTSEAWLLIWSVAEGAMRRLAERNKVELEKPAAGAVALQLTTLGLIDRDTYAFLRKALTLRNKAMHGLQAKPSAGMQSRFMREVEELLES